MTENREHDRMTCNCDTCMGWRRSTEYQLALAALRAADRKATSLQFHPYVITLTIE